MAASGFWLTAIEKDQTEGRRLIILVGRRSFLAKGQKLFRLNQIRRKGLFQRPKENLGHWFPRRFWVNFDHYANSTSTPLKANPTGIILSVKCGAFHLDSSHNISTFKINWLLPRTITVEPLNSANRIPLNILLRRQLFETKTSTFSYLVIMFIHDNWKSFDSKFNISVGSSQSCRSQTNGEL